MNEREVQREEWVREDTRRLYEGASCLAGCVSLIASSVVVALVGSLVLSFGVDEGVLTCALFPALFVVAALFYGRVMEWFKRKVS